jgi:hypothetical protein
MWHFTSFFLKFKSNLPVNKFFLLNAAFAMTILDLISQAHLPATYNGFQKSFQTTRAVQLLFAACMPLNTSAMIFLPSTLRTRR